MINQEASFIAVLVAIGIETARLIYGLLQETCEAVVLMLREKLKWKPHKSLSTDEEHSGGLESVILWGYSTVTLKNSKVKQVKGSVATLKIQKTSKKF